MILRNVFLGIDTSNYTTSVAVCSEDGEITANFKKLLPVAKGERGLRQSDALFRHTVQLPELFDKVREEVGGCNVLAVGVSERPRDAEGSYMPCFLAGRSAAYATSAASGCEYYGFSHQCGHIAAALYSAGREDLYGSTFAAFHVSGGTTDILLASPDENKAVPFKVERIGGSADINAGQAIDRAGVMMGLDFPCGPAVEKLALENSKSFEKMKLSVRGLECNMSGIENKAHQMYDESGDRCLVSAFVLDFISRNIEKLTLNLREAYKDIPVVYAGGVMSCSLIKKRMSLYGAFAEPQYSSDNAAGAALLARRKFLKI